MIRPRYVWTKPLVPTWKRGSPYHSFSHAPGNRSAAARMSAHVAMAPYRGARFARMRCSVRRCMFSRRAVSETLWLHSS